MFDLQLRAASCVAHEAHRRSKVYGREVVVRSLFQSADWGVRDECGEGAEVSKHTNCGHFNLADALFILFLYLKLAHQIDWSWWWVFSPVSLQIVVRLFATSLGDE